MITTIDNNISTSISLGYANVSLRKDGIVNTNIIINDAISLEQAKELFLAYLKICEGKKLPHLFTLTNFVIMEKEVMEFIAKTANKQGKADAFVIHSLPQKIIGNFYLKFHQPSVPTKLFTSKKKAITWLRGYLKEPR